MVRKHVWKVFSFSGWFVTLVAVIFGLIYASISLSTAVSGAGVLVVFGIILVLLGEYLFAEYKDKRLQMVWNALSIGGAFSLTVGIIWVVTQFLEAYKSKPLGVAILLVIGLVLIGVGEGIKIQK